MLLAALLALAMSTASGQAEQLRALHDRAYDLVTGVYYGYTVDRDISIRAGDGTPLALSLYLPRRGSPPYPTLLLLTPYGKDQSPEVDYWVRRFAPRGYAIAAGDMRGRYRSGGDFMPYAGIARDASETLDWLASRPWSNGRVGTVGCSALGEIQVLLAAERNRHHAAMVPLAAGGAMGSADGRFTYFGIYEGGIFNLASGVGWFLYNGGRGAAAAIVRGTADLARDIRHLPTVDLVRRHRADTTGFEELLSTPLSDPFWRRLGYIADDDRFATPGLHVNTWHDQSIGETLKLAEFMKRNTVPGTGARTQKVLVGPGDHCNLAGAATEGSVGDLKLGSGARQPFEDWISAFLDKRLRPGSDADDDLPPYRFYIVGEDRWADTTAWPPPGARLTRWYLAGNGPANSVAGGGRLSLRPPVDERGQDEFLYDPLDPVPTRGGPICCTGDPADRSGPVDQRDVEVRDDVLVYTSEVLTRPMRLAGPIAARIFFASSALDTDIVVKLVDVFPDGTALNIQEGALRLRYRDGVARPRLMSPGTVYRVGIDMRAIAYYLPAGHRLRVQLSSSSFPRLERNLNTGGRNFDETAGVAALNTVHRSADAPSHVAVYLWDD